MGLHLEQVNSNTFGRNHNLVPLPFFFASSDISYMKLITRGLKIILIWPMYIQFLGELSL